MLGWGVEFLRAEMNRLLSLLFHQVLAPFSLRCSYLLQPLRDVAFDGDFVCSLFWLMCGLCWQGVLDEQFLQLQQLQDESSPNFVSEVITIYFHESEKLLRNLRLLLYLTTSSRVLFFSLLAFWHLGNVTYSTDSIHLNFTWEHQRLQDKRQILSLLHTFLSYNNVTPVCVCPLSSVDPEINSLNVNIRTNSVHIEFARLFVGHDGDALETGWTESCRTTRRWRYTWTRWWEAAPASVPSASATSASPSAPLLSKTTTPGTLLFRVCFHCCTYSPEEAKQCLVPKPFAFPSVFCSKRNDPFTFF